MSASHPALASIATPLPLIGHHIGGGRVTGASGRTANIYCPATGALSAELSLASADEVDRAAQAAARAFPGWSATPPHVRARVLFRFRDLVERNIDELATLINREHGKVLSDARGEVTRGLEVVEFACAAPTLLKGEYSENVGRDVDGVSFRQPLGLVAGITPFNFPVMVPMWMFPVAIACGNSFILKTSEKVPSAAMYLADLLNEAGLPDGVFNIVNGDREAVDAILDHPLIKAVSFVGSTPVAAHVHSRATATGKRVQALGGAKNHMVVMPDADLDQVVDALMGAAYGSAGERCMAISVAVPVGEATADALVAKLAPRVAALRIGAGLDPGDDMGPLVSTAHRDKVSSYVDVGVEEGAHLVVDGRGHRVTGHDAGFFIGGTLFDRVTTDMRVYQEEIFGPVLSIVRSASLDAALDVVNRHPFGNGTAIMTNDGDAAHRFMSRVEAGMVGVNVPIPVPMAFHSFGGWKQSLFGDHHIHGMEGVRFYTRLKAGTIRWAPGQKKGADFSMPTMA